MTNFKGLLRPKRIRDKEARLVYARNQKGGLDAFIWYAPYIGVSTVEGREIVLTVQLPKEDTGLSLDELTRKYPVKGDDNGLREGTV